MKRSIKLTESDLSKIVRRIVRESDDEKGGSTITMQDIKSAIEEAVEEYGVEDGITSSMRSKINKLAKRIMQNFKDDLAYIGENYEDEIEDIVNE